MISFIIQGPTNHKLGFPIFSNGEWQAHYFTTQECIDSLKKWYPDSEIIVSCTTGDADDLVGVDQLFYITDDMLEFPDNVNRQILSSQVVKHARHDIVCKVRSDMVAGAGLLTPYVINELLGKRPYARIETHKMFERFVFTSNWSSELGFLYHPSDWLFLGLKTDIESIFDIPQRLHTDWPIGPEQYITVRCMENHGLQKYIDYNWIENHGNRDSHIGKMVPPEDHYSADWWRVFFNNFCVLDNGWTTSDLQTAPETEGQSGLMSQKYLERVGPYGSLVNHRQWLAGHKKVTS